MILWDGQEMHDPERPDHCWGTGPTGNECGRPAGPDGLCGPCRERIGRRQ